MNSIELSTALRGAVSSLHKVLRKQGYESSSYSLTELDTLWHLHRRSSLLPSELASLTKIKTQSMSQILKKMEEEGIIERTPCDKDKRKIHISLTPKGRQMVEKRRNDNNEWLKNMIDEKLSSEDKQMLINVIPILNKLSNIE